MADASHTSGEVNSIILGLLKEGRDDAKKILEQQAAMNAKLEHHITRLGDGDHRMNAFEVRLSRVEVVCGSPGDGEYHPKRSLRTTSEATTRKIPKIDASAWVKIGLLVGGIVGGYLAATGGKGTP